MKRGSSRDRVAVAAAKPERRFDPAAGIAVLLAGCLLTFYLIGIPVIAVGAWMLAHSSSDSL